MKTEIDASCAGDVSAPPPLIICVVGEKGKWLSWDYRPLSSLCLRVCARAFGRWVI